MYNDKHLREETGNFFFPKWGNARFYSGTNLECKGFAEKAISSYPLNEIATNLEPFFVIRYTFKKYQNFETDRKMDNHLGQRDVNHSHAAGARFCLGNFRIVLVHK